jgi:hypothetical protein
MRLAQRISWRASGIVLSLAGFVVVAGLALPGFSTKGMAAEGKAGAVLAGWTGPYLPASTKAIIFVNVGKIRESDLYPQVDKALREMGNPLKQIGVKIGPNDVSELLAVFAEFNMRRGPDEPCIIFRCEKDLALGEIVDQGRFATKTIDGATCVSLPHDAFLAKTEPRTYCFAQGEDALKKVFERVHKKETAEVSDALKGLLEKCSDGEHYFVAAAGKGQADALAASLSIGDTVRVKVSVTHPNEADAKDAESNFTKGKERLEKDPDVLPPKLRAQRENVLNVVRGARLTRSGQTLDFTASAKMRDLKAFLADFVIELMSPPRPPAIKESN